MSTPQTWLIEGDELERELHAPDLVIMDATWHLPGEAEDAHGAYLAEHIPGALFFDIDDIAETNTSLPHMMPSPEKFSSRMRKMGIGDGQRIVVYDQHGMYSAPRAWWTFLVMGANDVAVLNGGLPKWKAEGRPLMMGEPSKRTPRHFTSRHNLDLVRDIGDMKTLLKDNAAHIIDARPPGRFAGTEAEPRADLRPGHIPGALNVPYQHLVNGDGTLKSSEELREVFNAAGVDPHKPVVTTCGSGVTACVLALALSQTGHRRISVYDGSWAEWGADESLPIETS